MDLLIQEQDKLKDKIIKMTLSILHTLIREDILALAQGNKWSTKLSNPPILTNGKDPKFKN